MVFFYLLFIYTALTGMVEGKLWMYFSEESVKLTQKNLPLQRHVSGKRKSFLLRNRIFPPSLINHAKNKNSHFHIIVIN